MINRALFLNTTLNKVIIVAVAILISINGYLYFNNRVKEQKLINANNIINQEKETTKQLKAQLDHAKKQLNDYQEQVKKLNDNLLTHLHQAEKRTDEIKQALQDESWSGQPVPNRIIRLFNERTHQINRADTATLPDRSTMPKTDNNTKK